MTFPCKEELVRFEQHEARQKQIYPDAADSGILLGSLSDKELNAMRVDLNEMLKVFKKPQYGYAANNWHGGRSVEFFIPIEMDEGMEHGYQFRVAFCRDGHLPGGGFISIDIIRTARHPQS
jgi:hypothetical protein